MKIYTGASNGHNLVFSDYFQLQNRNIVLLTHYWQSDPSYETINSYILQRFINLELQNLPMNEITELLKGFINDLHWELLSRFRAIAASEKGVSIAIIVAEANKLIVTPTGRFVCGYISDKAIVEQGKIWDNFHVKSKEELGLLGSFEQDILVKPLEIELENSSIFCCFPASVLKELNVKQLGKYELVPQFEEHYHKIPFPYALVVHDEKREKKLNSWYNTNKFRFTISLMFLLLLFSVYYLYFGKNKVEDSLKITREQFQLTLRNIDVLKLQEMIPLDYGMLFVPKNNIELTVEWESTLPYKITLPPSFDLRYLFVTSNNKITAYDKKEKTAVWKREFEDNIGNVNILDANLMLIATVDNRHFCLKRDSGSIVWDKIDEKDSPIYKANPYNVLQISLEMDRRLSSGIVLLPSAKNLILLNILNGDTLFYYDAESEIKYISDYDYIDKSIYIVMNNTFSKVRFEVRN